MRLGIDVGGTNTDAVIVSEQGDLIGTAKHLTTPDILTGIREAIRKVLNESGVAPKNIRGIFLGTTHSLNALQYAKGLSRSALIRIQPSPSLIQPMLGWPASLQEMLAGYYQLTGGYTWEGKRVEAEDRQLRLATLIEELRLKKVEAAAVVCSFSPLYADEEKDCCYRLREALPQLDISMSHEIGSMGFIERENATLMNAMLSKVIRHAMQDINQLFDSLSLNAPYWFTQNDGSLMPVEHAMKYPIFTLGSGTTNSLRGAAFLTGMKDAIVIDMGGSTIDIGRVMEGHPQESITESEIRGIKVNVRLPRVHSLSYGGGSVIRKEQEKVEVADTVASNIEELGLAWGGNLWTLSDSFLKLYPGAFPGMSLQAETLGDVAAGDCRVAVRQVMREIREQVERLQPLGQQLPVILVGGASPLLAAAYDDKYGKTVHPRGYQFCSAIGACRAPVSLQHDQVLWLQHRCKEEVVWEAKRLLLEQLEKEGAKDTAIVSYEEYPFTYLEGDVIRLRLKAAGELQLSTD